MRITAALASLLLLTACGDNLTHPPVRDPYGEDAGTLACTPNLDGHIDAVELQAAFGVPVSYLVSPPGETRAVDLVGKSDGMGGRDWDFSADFASDTIATLTASDLVGKWYAASFPTGKFASAIDAGGTLDGIYASDEHAISLLGVASVTEKPKESKTLLVYGTPVDIYRFPLAPGANWVSVGQTMPGGMIRGLPFSSKDTYDVKDDSLGQLVLHDFTFTQVHRVRTTVTVEPAAGQTTVQKQVGFVFECFGEVTRATSLPNEKADDFTMAAEVRRLGK